MMELIPFFTILVYSISTLAVGQDGSTSGPTSCDCGVPQLDQHKIVGGQSTGVDEYPWMVSLHRTASLLLLGPERSQFCGGTLISSSWVLTAAHCVINYSMLPLLVTVNVGVNDLSVGAMQTKAMRRIASKITVNTGYSPTKLTNDLAVIKMASPVSYGDSIQPLCLPSLDLRDLTAKTVTVTGYGSTAEGGRGSVKLLQANIPVVSQDSCQQSYNSTGVQITNDMFCAGQPGRDSCQGDSGGPVQVQCSGYYSIVGIVSFGIGCARVNFPGVYTRVTSFISWIKQATGSDLCNRGACVNNAGIATITAEKGTTVPSTVATN